MEAKVPSLQLTYEDYLQFPDDGKRHELIDGEHYVTPASTTRHQEILVNLLALLRAFVHERRLGKVYVAPVDVLLSDVDVVEPDLLYVAAQRAAIIENPYVKGAPDLVVEVLSPSTRRTDALIKRKLYEKFRVAEYWIVDPELEIIEVYRQTAEGFRRVAESSREEKQLLTSPLFPGLELSLDDVFE